MIKSMKKIFLGLILVVLTGVMLCACEGSQEAIEVDLEERKEINISDRFEGITYAYLPQYSHRVSYKRHHQLVDYLRKKTGLDIRQVFPDTFDEHMKMVGQGAIDISFSNPLIYVKIAHRYQARAFARIVEKGGHSKFRGQIICRADNKAIQNIQDCRGKSWIAVDPSSAGGYLFILDYFLSQGIELEDFSEVAFAPGPGGKQEKVVLAVYAGKYDIGSIREGTLEVVGDKIDRGQIRVLAHTPWYPGWVYAARKGLDHQVVEKIKKALLSLDKKDPEQARILKQAGFVGVIASNDEDYDPLRRMVKRAEIELDE
jgi:phosphonate transport system substrate-binding protein